MTMLFVLASMLPILALGNGPIDTEENLPVEAGLDVASRLVQSEERLKDTGPIDTEENLPVEAGLDVASRLVQSEEPLKDTDDQPFSASGAPRDLPHDLHIGDLMGDIMIGEGLQKALSSGETGPRRRYSLKFDFVKWDDGVAKYAFEKDYPETWQKNVRDNMDYMEKVLHPESPGKCVSFKETNPNDDHVAMIIDRPKQSCYAMIGKDKLYGGVVDVIDKKFGALFDGKQGVNLAGKCQDPHTIRHELMHMLGFFHEHARWDRDEYITMNWDRIPGEDETNYWRIPTIIAETHGTPYDYDSVMHYIAGGTASAPYMETKDKSKQNTIGWKPELSKLDIFEIRRAYNCPVISEEDCECKNNWTVNGETVHYYCGNPDNRSGGDWCPHVNPKCGSGKGWSRCKPYNDLWADGSICGLGTTCNHCKHKATYWYGKAFTACGYEPRWNDGTRCLAGTSCNACKNSWQHWYSIGMTACGMEPKWKDGSLCAKGTSCNRCKNGNTYWYGKAWTACGNEPKWDDGHRCAAGTSCNICKNSYSFWHGKGMTACGKEPCWGKGTRCYGLACRQCCGGAHQPWYWFGGGQCK